MEVTKSQIMTFAGFMPVDVINQQGPTMSKPLIIQLLGQARSGKEHQCKFRISLLNNSVLPFCNRF